ncbi:MAG TPA: TIGR04282 family arsenosugar biosynthesis glycosyltransferase [Thermodesulfovibrionales bacterium]|nr:TIGR04282 family arsenosugar biosynthesis glycosyltransferase [Thermodesulfovibrionales bacterium]
MKARRSMSGGPSVILFVRSPERGKVKSRLAAAIGKEMALEVYKGFVLDIIETLKKGHYPFRLFFYPRSSEGRVVKWLGKDFVYFPQEGSDIGKRMENAFIQSFSMGSEKVVLIGSDIPDLPNSVIDRAFSSLYKSDAVVGPASDGGYYLIGFKTTSFLPDIFHGIHWSTSSVCQETMAIFRHFQLRVHVLRQWNDVDTFDDLRTLFKRNQHTDFRVSRSMSLCKRIFQVTHYE